MFLDQAGRNRSDGSNLLLQYQHRGGDVSRPMHFIRYRGTGIECNRNRVIVERPDGDRNQPLPQIAVRIQADSGGLSGR